jgi:hypothetical protein
MHCHVTHLYTRLEQYSVYEFIMGLIGVFVSQLLEVTGLCKFFFFTFLKVYCIE